MAEFCSNCEELYDIDLSEMVSMIDGDEGVGFGVCDGCSIQGLAQIKKNVFEGLYIVDGQEVWRPVKVKRSWISSVLRNIKGR